MSRSRLLRSHSSDDILNRALNYSSSLAYDNAYPSSFDYSYPLEYDLGYQSRHDRGFSSPARYNEMDTNHYQRHPVKERRVRWALPEPSTTRNRLASTTERSSSTHGSDNYRNSNPACPIHGYKRYESPDRYNLDTSSYNSRHNTSRLYEIRPSSRDFSSRYTSSQYGAPEPKSSRDYLQSSSGPRTITHRYPSLSSLKSPFSNTGYYPSIETDYRGRVVNSLLASQSNLQRPKWRRSIIGLNQWGMY
ncbi:hypothetical protein PCANC_22512 [Puccinia coronata f. sp. avenae]|uniref:Uncharacterized protein n=1 Tax=Puccinia coronata f. sp. avenae TaxID=200324 RepID=A0A2N5SXC6_9BASI|nr:hypothetical protein PCANC_22512 [Puccinia coronata f. sp. avenae]PLW17872.1 hypothetical protein PCASD_19679 [Puccinia coronata f. sp. avenae]PLW51088.1 hypothetical protein PCASD_02415 [Puccinia coronata f. sp. avenae]